MPKLNKLFIVASLFILAYLFSSIFFGLSFCDLDEICEFTMKKNLLVCFLIFLTWPSLVLWNLGESNEVILWFINIVYYYLFVSLVVSLWNFYVRKRM